MRAFIQLFMVLSIVFATGVSANDISHRGKHTVSCVPFSLAALSIPNTWLEGGKSGYKICRIIHVKN